MPLASLPLVLLPLLLFLSSLTPRRNTNFGSSLSTSSDTLSGRGLSPRPRPRPMLSLWQSDVRRLYSLFKFLCMVCHRRCAEIHSSADYRWLAPLSCPTCSTPVQPSALTKDAQSSDMERLVQTSRPGSPSPIRSSSSAQTSTTAPGPAFEGGRFLQFNCNGIQHCHAELQDFLHHHQMLVSCVQETKLSMNFDALLEDHGNQMVLGDLNAHHPSWFSRTGQRPEGRPSIGQSTVRNLLLGTEISLLDSPPSASPPRQISPFWAVISSLMRRGQPSPRKTRYFQTSARLTGTDLLHQRQRGNSLKHLCQPPALHPLNLRPSRSRLCWTGFEDSQHHKSPIWVELGFHNQNPSCAPSSIMPPPSGSPMCPQPIWTNLRWSRTKLWGSRPVAFKRPRRPTSEPRLKSFPWGRI